MDENLFAIKKEITHSMANAGFRVYAAIADVYGVIKVIDEQLQPYEDIITRSIEININFIGIGDYAIPLSNKNLMIFKISKKSIVVLFANKGNIAQLLSFKKNIKYFSEQIDNLLGEVEVPETIPTVLPPPEEKKVKKKTELIFGKELPNYYPLVDKKVDTKFRATVEEIGILQLCDGQHSFSEIESLTKLSADYVFDYLNKQIKKKVIFSKAYPIVIQCPDCELKHYFYVLKSTFEDDSEPFKILIRSEKCNHEYVVFLNKKLKIETQSFKYFTEFQKDKFMKRLGEHYYTIIS